MLLPFQGASYCHTQKPRALLWANSLLALQAAFIPAHVAPLPQLKLVQAGGDATDLLRRTDYIQADIAHRLGLEAAVGLVQSVTVEDI